MFGFLNVNKPSGITSHKVISILRKITGIKQIGHAGTLDPLASGVLPVAIGKASKLIDYLSEDKEYIAGLYFGKISDTYDIEGEVKEFSNNKITIEEIETALKNFQGRINQAPPMYSAVHYNGKRLYELAREGKNIDNIEKREIFIYKNEIISFDYEKQLLKLDIACSKGTYIRSIVHDLGMITNRGAVMCELIRTKSSGLKIENSLELNENLTKEIIAENLINPIKLINLPKLELTEEEYKKLLNGHKFKQRGNIEGKILLTRNNIPSAIAESNNEFIQPKKVLIWNTKH